MKTQLKLSSNKEFFKAQFCLCCLFSLWCLLA